jgi:hypothetical protein
MLVPVRGPRFCPGAPADLASLTCYFLSLLSAEQFKLTEYRCTPPLGVVRFFATDRAGGGHGC